LGDFAQGDYDLNISEVSNPLDLTPTFHLSVAMGAFEQRRFSSHSQAQLGSGREKLRFVSVVPKRSLGTRVKTY
jgi:hypothetical protein